MIKKVILICVVVLFILTAWFAICPPELMVAERTVAVVYHGHHATYTRHAIYHDDWLRAVAFFGMYIFLQVGLPLWFGKPYMASSS